MALPEYQRQVTSAPLPSTEVVKPPIAAFGYNIAETGEKVGQTMSAVGKMIFNHNLERQQQLDSAAVLSTDAKLKQDLYNVLYHPENGLMLKQGLSADKITQLYDAEATKIAQKHLQTLPGQNQQLQAQRMFEQGISSMRGGVIAHEAKEVRTGKLAALDTSIDTSLALLLKNPTAPGNVESAFAAIEARAPELISLLGKENVPAAVKKKMNAFVAATVDAYINNGQLGAANEIVDKYADKLDPTVVAKAKAGITSRQQTFDVHTMVEQMKTNPDFLTPDGTFDKAKGIAHLQNTLGINAKGAPIDQAMIDQHLTGAVQGLNGTFLSKLARLAKDKGQKLEIGDGFRTREEQAGLWEKSDKTGKMVAAPGNSRHEAGFAIDAEWAKGMSDAELAKYGLYRPMDYEPWHVEPIETKGKSTAELMKMRDSGGGGFDPEMLAKATALWSAAAELSEVAKKQEINNKMDSLVSMIRDQKPTSTAQLTSIVDGLGLQGKEWASAFSYAKTLSGLTQVQTDPLAYSNALKDLDEGMSPQQLRLKYSDSVSVKQLDILADHAKTFTEKAVRNVLTEKLKEAKLNGTPDEDIVREKVLAEAKAWQNDPKNANKKMTVSDIQDIFQQQIAKVVLVKNRLLKNQMGILAEVPYWMQLDDTSPYVSVKNAQGQDIFLRPTRYDKKTRNWYTTIDGKEVNMNQLAR